MPPVMMFIIACGVASLLYGLYAGRLIMSAPTGSEKMVNIAAAIQEGARAYLSRQYQAIELQHRQLSGRRREFPATDSIFGFPATRRVRQAHQ